MIYIYEKNHRLLSNLMCLYDAKEKVFSIFHVKVYTRDESRKINLAKT